MNSHSRRNQAAESRLIDESEIEQRAVQIARDEGRTLVIADDRARAREELLAPNETLGDPEVAPELGGDRIDEDAPGTSGSRAPTVRMEDDHSIGKDLVEKGMREPRANREAEPGQD